MLGDLIEEFAVRAQTQTGSAAVWWYWGQILRSLAPLLASVARRRRWLATAGVAVIGFITAAATGTAAETMLLRLLGAETGLPAILRLSISLAGILAGGFLAARIRPRAEDVMAAMVFVAIAWMMAMANMAPSWYVLAFLVVGPATALAGGRLSRR